MISRFNLYLPKYFLKNKTGVNERFHSVRDSALKKLSGEGLETSHRYAYGVNRKSKVTKAKKSSKAKSSKKTLKGKKHQKKVKKHHKKTKKSRR